MPSFVTGQKVYVVKGTHVNKTATVILTKKRVHVRFDSDGCTTWLAQTSLEPFENNSNNNGNGKGGSGRKSHSKSVVSDDEDEEDYHGASLGGPSARPTSSTKNKVPISRTRPSTEESTTQLPPIVSDDEEVDDEDDEAFFDAAEDMSDNKNDDSWRGEAEEVQEDNEEGDTEEVNEDITEEEDENFMEEDDKEEEISYDDDYDDNELDDNDDVGDEELDFDASEAPLDDSDKENKSSSKNKSKRGVRVDPNFHNIFGQRIEFIQVLAPGAKDSLREGTMAGLIFGGRLLPVKFQLNSKSEALPKRGIYKGYTYELLASKVNQENHFKGLKVHKGTAYYVAVAGPDMSTINLRDELDKLAGLGQLPPKKAASRLELLFSTPQDSTRTKGPKFYSFDEKFTVSDFELIDDMSGCIHSDGDLLGCGFIPRSYMEEMFGKHLVGKRTCAIQVRVFVPKMGAFKGVLVEKNGISKIQLSAGMQKVGPSTRNDIVGDEAYLIVRAVFPSKHNVQLAKIMNGNKGKPVPNSFEVKSYRKMHLKLLDMVGVPEAVIEEYSKHRERSKEAAAFLKDTSMLGIVDATGEIPPDHVFITRSWVVSSTKREPVNGLSTLEEVFVARFPCTEKSDSRVLQVLHSKPPGMSDESWAYLENLPFGHVVFGNPRPGEAPIPVMLGGDCDGDLYWVIWDPSILDHMCRDIPRFDVSRLNNKPRKLRPYSKQWLTQVQELTRDVPSIAKLHMLIGKLYKLWEQCENDQDALYFGRAYKEALDIGKHGGQVQLPARLWSALRNPALYSLLVDMDESLR